MLGDLFAGVGFERYADGTFDGTLSELDEAGILYANRCFNRFFNIKPKL